MRESEAFCNTASILNIGWSAAGAFPLAACFGNSCKVAPSSSQPSSKSKMALAELSTPPLMASITFWGVCFILNDLSFLTPVHGIVRFWHSPHFERCLCLKTTKCS